MKLTCTLLSGLAIASLVAASTPCLHAQAATSAITADNTTLKFALVFSRHGVRPPTKTNDAYNLYASQNFPDWSVPPGYLTVHGAQLMTIMGSYYRQYFVSQGLLTGNDQTDAQSEYYYADNAERTYATAQSLAAGLLPSVTTTVNEQPSNITDPLFYPVKNNLGSPNFNLASAATNGRIGADPAAYVQAYKAQLSLLESVLQNAPISDPTYAPSYITSVGAMPFSITPGTGGNIINSNGSIDTASTLAEIFILEYCEGKDPGQIGWGRLSEDQIIDIAKLHTADFDLIDRTPYNAQALGSNLLIHIVNTLNQAATGVALPQSLGSPSQKLVILVGHDNQLAAVGGLLRADWSLPTFANDDTPPGGSMTFELRQSNSDGSLIVRTYYTAATMDQQHNAVPLSLQTPPGIAPIFLPNASTGSTYYDAPLATFTNVMMAALNKSFTN